jgi:hypothetical protein
LAQIETIESNAKDVRLVVRAKTHVKCAKADRFRTSNPATPGRKKATFQAPVEIALIE